MSVLELGHEPEVSHKAREFVIRIGIWVVAPSVCFTNSRRRTDPSQRRKPSSGLDMKLEGG